MVCWSWRQDRQRRHPGSSLGHRFDAGGCIIYDNGWTGTDRGHGHAIYTQNQDGVKTISDCIMTRGRSYTMHAYGSSRAYVDNYLIEGNVVIASGQPRPTDAPARVVVRPSRYDPQRAHVIVFNWTKSAEVEVRPDGFLKAGDTFRLLNPCDIFGKPVLEGQYSAGPLRVPAQGEFAAFVLLKSS